MLVAYAHSAGREFEIAYWNGSTWIGATGVGEVWGVYAWSELLYPQLLD